MIDRLRILGAPGVYIQGPGALERLGTMTRELGSTAVLVSDRGVVELFATRIGAALTSSGVAFHALPFDGEVMPETVEKLAAQARAVQAKVVIAAGGGKGIDAGKAVSRELDARLITLPTAASNDGPTSRIFIYYDNQHRLISAERIGRNPDLVLVDTTILAAAPPALLVSGIGDALVKRFEAAQCINSGGPNMFGGSATLAAQAMADASDQVLREHAVRALAVAGTGKPNESFEKVIEACILLAGMGFEGSGLSIAHAMTRGLSAVKQTAHALHGLQVAYALLVQFVLEDRSQDFMHEQFAFHRSVGLPTCLAELGLTAPQTYDFETIAELSHAAPHTRNFERTLRPEDIAQAMHRLETLRAVWKAG